MSLDKPVYHTGRAPDDLPETLLDFMHLDCCNRFSDPQYTPPTPEQVGRLIELTGWSQTEVAKITGTNYNEKKGSPTVRRWKTPADKKDSRSIPYAAWRLMLINAGIVTEKERFIFT